MSVVVVYEHRILTQAEEGLLRGEVFCPPQERGLWGISHFLPRPPL